MERDTSLGAYRDQLGHLEDAGLKREWDAALEAEEWGRLGAVKHEMALRFLGKPVSQGGRKDARSYFWDKLLSSAGRFGELVAEREWFQAKYLYDQACMLTAFLEIPEELRRRLFGYMTDEDVYLEGIFEKKAVNKVMNQCVVKNRLGYDCMVYRIPGEAGYHGSHREPGLWPDREMKEEENPAYLQEASGQ